MVGLADDGRCRYVLPSHDIPRIECSLENLNNRFKLIGFKVETNAPAQPRFIYVMYMFTYERIRELTHVCVYVSGC